MKNSVYKNKTSKQMFISSYYSRKMPCEEKGIYICVFKFVCEDNIEIPPKPSKIPYRIKSTYWALRINQQVISNIVLQLLFLQLVLQLFFYKNKRITVYLQKKIENVQNTKKTNSSNFTNHLPLQLTFGFFMYNYTQKLYRYLHIHNLYKHFYIQIMSYQKEKLIKQFHL